MAGKVDPAEILSTITFHNIFFSRKLCLNDSVKAITYTEQLRSIF